MLNSQKKVTIEWLDGLHNNHETDNSCCMSNPFNSQYSNTDKLSLMIMKILHEEIPQLKDNSLLYDLVLYTLIEKMKTVQTVENVLSYIKENHVKTVHDVSIKSGEIRIKCSG